MPRYTLSFIRSFEVADRTRAFEFSKPEGFTFSPGQFANLTIRSEDTDEKGNTRSFSIASAPSDERLLFATRMRSTAFKRHLGGLQPDDAVEMFGPAGKFTLDDTDAILFAGGIGITPFRSMLRECTKNGFKHKITLVYSNKRPEDAPFLDELRALSNPNFTFIGVMTQMDRSHVKWDGPQGIINDEQMRELMPHPDGITAYVAGPPGFTTAMTGILKRMEVKRFKTDEFSGY